MSYLRTLVATGAVGLLSSGCGVDSSRVGVTESAALKELDPGELAGREVDVAVPKELDLRETVIVRVPFDERGQAQAEQAEMRVLGQSSSEFVIQDFKTAEQAWKQAKAPPRMVQQQQRQAKVENVAETVQPPGYYTWNRGFPPAYYNGGYRWGYGLPGFYFGWNAGRGGYSFGYGPGYGWGYGPGFGYAGGYGGWYGHPTGYGATYPGWYRPGFGYYYYPRHLGAWHRH